MNNLVIVMPWYGKIPNYFKFYIDGVRNISFDTLIVSDLDFSDFNMPPNVRCIRMSMQEFAELASKKLGVSVALDKPYKVCDFRPMFGKIFEDHIAEYKYWGYGDCDLIYGKKLDSYVESVVAGDYDVASMHKQYLSGPFAMIKNNEECNLLFQKSRDWKIVATTPTHYQFEECGRKVDWPRLEFGEQTIEDYGKEFSSFSYVLHLEEENGTLRYFHEDLITEHIEEKDAVYKREGCLFLNDDEVMIVHLLFVKGRRYFMIPGDCWKRFGEYLIDSTGFYSPSQVKWRWLLRRIRVFSAILTSLRVNGLKRIASRIKLGR